TSTPLLSLSYSAPHRDLHSFPTRRSSDLQVLAWGQNTRRHGEQRKDTQRSGRQPSAHQGTGGNEAGPRETPAQPAEGNPAIPSRDRKSTRLNSSHVKISYAVFCLKKKKST